MKTDDYFQIILESVSPSYLEAMQKKDFDAIQGLGAIDMARRWAIANTGSLILSYLFKETLKNYNVGARIPELSYGVIIRELKKRNISVNRIDMVIDALIDGNFLIMTEKEVKSLEGIKIYKMLRLTDVWRFFLNKYKADKKQTIIFTHQMGKQIYASYLAKNREQFKLPTGVSSIKTMFIILNNANKEGQIDSAEGEKIFNKIGGVVMWHDIGEGDEIKKDQIKFFTRDDGKKKTINTNVLKAFNNYLMPNFNKLTRKRGLK